MTPLPADTLKTRSFGWFTLTQGLGAFNDNVFKQIMLLMAAAGTDTDKQGLVVIVFTLPFMFFSGYGGQLSEIFGKTTILRATKLMELVIMAAATVGFLLGSTPLLLIMLFLMGAQTALFQPAKYGIIPELVKERLLVPANGIVQVCYLAAITLGIAMGGALKQQFSGSLYQAMLTCVVIAIIGYLTVLGIRTRAANLPGTRFDPHPFRRLGVSFKAIFQDGPLTMATLAFAYFYFSGTVVTNLVNNYGLRLLGLNDQRTSLMLAFLTLGIIAGSLLAGPLCLNFGRKRTILTGAVGVVAVKSLMFFHMLPLSVLHGILLLAGVFSSLYFIPISAFLQARPPMGRKGEILAAVNFTNYTGILLAALFWQGLMLAGLPAPYVWLLLAGGLVLLLTRLWPRLEALD